MMRGGLPGARWIDPENYHLTLRFIGDIDDALAHDIAGLLSRVQRRPFELRLDGLASFGGRKPRALVASATAVPPLLELQAEQERLLQRLGLDPEGRKYIPHVTLARLRETSSWQVADYFVGTRPFPFGRVQRSRASSCSRRAHRSAADPMWSRPPIRSAYPSSDTRISDAVIPDWRESAKCGIDNHRQSSENIALGLWISGSRLRRAPE